MTKLTPTLLRELREKAGRATEGPWRSDSCGDVWTESPNVPMHWIEELGCKVFRTVGTTPRGPDAGDAAHIAACDPTTVLALVSALETAVGALKYTTNYSNDLHVVRAAHQALAAIFDEEG